MKNGVMDSGTTLTTFDNAIALTSILFLYISYQSFNLFLIISRFNFFLFWLIPFGSRIKIKGINDNEVIAITTNKPSEKPSTKPFSWILKSTYLDTKKPANDPVVRFAAKNIALCL